MQTFIAFYALGFALYLALCGLETTRASLKGYRDHKGYIAAAAAFASSAAVIVSLIIAWSR